MSAEVENRTVRELIPAVERLLGRPVRSLESLHGGANSAVFRAVTDQTAVVVKQYPTLAGDVRNRLEAEFSAGSFLWNQGFRLTPQPLARNNDSQLAAYELIDGQPVPFGQHDRDMLDQAIDFLFQLKALSKSAAAADLPAASEACFSLADLIDALDHRFGILTDLKSTGEDYGGLSRFLHDQVLPWRDRLTIIAARKLESARLPRNAELAMTERILSPSDFGFHNVVRRSDGRLIFIDLEYFGWDDPVKTLSDFIYHPAMSLSEADTLYFLTRTIPLLGSEPEARVRLEAFYPLYGLKWICIMLNPFRPEYRDRFGPEGQLSIIRRKRLDRTKRLLDRIKREHKTGWLTRVLERADAGRPVIGPDRSGVAEE